jgi:hypothetical protein
MFGLTSHGARVAANTRRLVDDESVTQNYLLGAESGTLLSLRLGHDSGYDVCRIEAGCIDVREMFFHYAKHGIRFMTDADKCILQPPQRLGRLHEEITGKHETIDVVISDRNGRTDQASWCLVDAFNNLDAFGNLHHVPRGRKAVEVEPLFGRDPLLLFGDRGELIGSGLVDHELGSQGL